MRRVVRGERVASRASEDLTKDRLYGQVLVAVVICVQLVWASVLVYLGFRLF